MSNDQKIMLIDESAFDLSTHPRDKEADAWFIAFLRDAQPTFKIIIVTHESPQTLKTKLNHIDFSEGFVEAAKVDQSFLTQDIRHWGDIDLDNVNVVMTHEHEKTPDNCPFPELVISSGSTCGPDSFYYWMDTYEDDKVLNAGSRIGEQIRQSLEEHDKETKQLLTTIFGDAHSLWNKIKADKKIKKLTDIFGEVPQKKWEIESAEERVITRLHGYFSYIVRKHYAPDTGKDIDGNLNAYKEGLEQSFRDHDIDEKYTKEEVPIELLSQDRKKFEAEKDRTLKEWLAIPISAEHTTIIHDAINRIEEIVRAEPINLQIN